MLAMTSRIHLVFFLSGWELSFLNFFRLIGNFISLMVTHPNVACTMGLHVLEEIL